MTGNIHERYLGKRFKLLIGGGLTIRVSCMDSRTRFTFIELLVTPEAGTGSTWIPLSTLTEINDDGNDVGDADASPVR